MRFLAFSLLMPVAAGAALAAQPAPPPEAGPRPDFAQMRAHRAEIRQRRADDIALLIGLRADQRPGLDAMLAAVEPLHGPRGPGAGTPPPPPPPPAGPEGEMEGTQHESFLAHLDRLSAHQDQMDDRAKQGLSAARAFYTSLDPDQQRRFDALDELRRIDMRGGGMGGMHGMHGGHDGPPPPPTQ
jgi:hypothetical protein